MAKAKKEKIKKDLKSIDAVLAAIKKEHGKTSVFLLGDKPKIDVDTISTGSMLVDAALGIGGLPRGRIVEVLGAPEGGKTTLSLHCIAEAQKNGGIAAFIDAEHALDINLARKMEVDTDNLIVNQPDSGEQALDILEMLIRSGKVDIAVVDSVSALVPQVELDGSMGDAQMGLQARLMGKALRKITAATSESNTLVIFINQIRMNIGQSWGNPEVSSGGKALKFFASVRLDIRRIGPVLHKKETIGNKVRVKVLKNKLAPPYKAIETELIFGRGFRKEGEILDLGVELGVIERKGPWYNRGKEHLERGRENVIKLLKEKPDMLDMLRTDIKIAQLSPDEDDDEN